MAEKHESQLKIFALNGNPDLAQKIADQVGVPLSGATVKHFSDGEIQIGINESVRNDDTFIVQSVSDPVNENFMELMIMIDALRRASARTINVVLPYFAYSRADRKSRPREPITAKLVSNLIEMDGATRVLTLDLHADQIQGFFDIPVDHLQAIPLLAHYFMNLNLGDSEDVVVVAPDHSTTKRARALAEYFGAQIAIVDKRDNKEAVDPLDIIGDVAGKTCIVIDDMIDTSTRVVYSANSLLAAGAKEVYAGVTHALFSAGAAESLQASAIKQIVVTDSIKIPEEKKFAKLAQVSVGPLLGQAVEMTYERQAVDELFQETAAEKLYMENKL
ncbi:ribose-phosphate diphosphokinase [Agrilactobacillus yilanensis]|uniref:Ribose-phosphate pyrophosphokinase n=1 Tax=Agrilactobacillus yilanensis TaxID=2485997 RepID=A0ABW4J994_9LACO|nr:ribose-phosphate pyrophosphokinase [Agrilactobacillus yilanensis]